MNGTTDLTTVIFGEVLYDRFPDGQAVLGGAPFNVAWNLQALGHPPLLVSRVGEDDLGRRILAAMGAWGLDIRGVQSDPVHATGTVEVTLVDGEPRYEIANGRAWDYIAADQCAPRAGRLLYHGSLALRSASSRTALARLRLAPGTDVFVDVNLRSPWWDREMILAILREARWAKMNGEELALIVRDELSTEQQAAHLQTECDLDGLVITLGAEGSVAFDSDGSRHFCPAELHGPVIDTVGAGDAFSAVTLLGLARDWPWPLILERAQDLAGAVVGLRGATTNDSRFYRTIAANWETP